MQSKKQIKKSKKIKINKIKVKIMFNNVKIMTCVSESGLLVDIADMFLNIP